MKTYLTLAVGVCAGMLIGGFAVQGLNAQGSKLKAFSIGEVENLGPPDANTIAEVRKAIAAARGHVLRTRTGRVVKVAGSEPPQAVGLAEWDNVDDAVAFYKSKAWTDLAPERDKFQKTVRHYIVEVEK